MYMNGTHMNTFGINVVVICEYDSSSVIVSLILNG